MRHSRGGVRRLSACLQTGGSVQANLETGDVVLRLLGVVQTAGADTLVEGRAWRGGRVAGEGPQVTPVLAGRPVPLGLAAARAGEAPATVIAATKAVAIRVLRMVRSFRAHGGPPVALLSILRPSPGTAS